MTKRINMEKLNNYLLMLGFPEHLKGTRMLRVACMLWYPGMAFTKELYPAVGKEFDANAMATERAIRHAIGVAWMRGDLATIERLFGNTCNPDTGVPTVSELVARLVMVTWVEE